MQREEIVDRVRKLELKPGDCIVVSTDRAVGENERRAAGAAMHKALEMAGICRVPVILLDRGFEINILRTSDLESSDAA